MNKYDYFTQLRSIDFVLFDFESLKKWREEDSSYDAYEFERRIYKEVHLNNDINSKNTFKYINQFVNDVVQTKDTINGLKIHFEENATYNEFIEVLNIFSEQDAEMYILDHNTMYFVGRDWNPEVEIYDNDEGLPSLPLDYFGCKLILAGDYNEQNINLNSFINNLKTQFLQNKIIYSAYGVLFLVGIFYIYRKSKKLPK